MFLKIVFVLITCFIAKAIGMPQLTRFGRSLSDLSHIHEHHKTPTIFSKLNLNDLSRILNSKRHYITLLDIKQETNEISTTNGSQRSRKRTISDLRKYPRTAKKMENSKGYSMLTTAISLEGNKSKKKD